MPVAARWPGAFRLKPRAVPTDGGGRILWSKIEGFDDWFREAAAGHPNDALAALMQERFGVAPARRALDNLRARLRVDGRAPRQASGPSPVEKFELADLTRKVRALEQRNTLYDVIGAKVLRAMTNLPPLPPVGPVVKSYARAGQTPEEAILLISDVQGGLKVDSHENGGLGMFNPSVVLDQMAYLQRKVVSICARYHPNIKRLHLWFLGDIVEGETIYGGQLREIEFGAIQQVLFLWDAFTSFQMAMASHFESVECRGVVGNHGRMGRKGEHSPMSNFDYLLYRMWAERLKGVKNIRWRVSESWWDMSDVMGWKWLLVHGDDTGQGFAGIPFYAVSRHKTRYRELFKELRSEYGDFDYMAMGHHSTAASFHKIHMNGAWPPGTEFSLKRLQLGDQPTQALIGMSAKHGVTWRRDIHLQPLRRWKEGA